MKNIPEENAEGEVRVLYQKLKKELKTGQVPLFFTYISPFPEYFEFITGQILKNLEDTGFIKLHQQISTDLETLINTMLPISDARIRWINRYKNSPSYYNLEKDAREVYKTNVTLALIFIALREAIKGWAVAAPQLTEKINRVKKTDVFVGHKEEEFVIEGYIMKNTDEKPLKQEIIASGGGMERNLFIEYLRLNQEDYFELQKSEKYLFLRVYVEKILLSAIKLLPSPVNSSINVVYELTSKYKDFPELLYLLSEQFPTYAAQRLIFSGYLLE